VGVSMPVGRLFALEVGVKSVRARSVVRQAGTVARSGIAIVAGICELLLEDAFPTCILIADPAGASHRAADDFLGSDWLTCIDEWLRFTAGTTDRLSYTRQEILYCLSGAKLHRVYLATGITLYMG
jgi:hypothetical protein